MSNPEIVAENGQFKVELYLNVEGKTVELRPIGALNENSKLDLVFDRLSKLSEDIKEVVFDLQGVVSANSIGIRAWLFFIEKIEPRMSLRFEKASETFVDMAGIVPNIFGKRGKLVSFCVPYQCANCKRRTFEFFKPEDIKYEDGSPQAPEAHCKTCNSTLEFDQHPDEYFGFLKNFSGSKAKG
ncbi:MAG: hypothetical protein A2X94_06680 [Bdellovibrionales bacterium GWB1_55_8]|nr:MAG: hypothetical protein A2X94_06680 [Bdellovibrionales bacterium GWB1_55_8]